MIKLGILGSQGRMGRWVANLIKLSYAEQAELAASAGRGDALEPLLQVDAVIDFSSPEAVVKLVDLALKSSEAALPAFVIGSTGWTDEQKKKLEALSKKTPVLVASNFSTGVTALMEILRRASPVLQKLGYQPVIVETHHRHKKDQPSGTALSLQSAIQSESPGEVQTVSVRGGEIIGDHEVTFYGTADHIVLGHFAQDRSIFARGAIEVALWLSYRRTGPRAIREVIDMQAYFDSLIEG